MLDEHKTIEQDQDEDLDIFGDLDDEDDDEEEDDEEEDLAQPQFKFTGNTITEFKEKMKGLNDEYIGEIETLLTYDDEMVIDNFRDLSPALLLKELFKNLFKETGVNVYEQLLGSLNEEVKDKVIALFAD